jgi:hypothetical protein
MASLRIPEKPICILFSHGGLNIEQGHKSTCTFKFTTIPPNCQLATFLEPGTIFRGDGKLISNFCKAPESRKTILEPIFLWHSPSDVTQSVAKYIEYSTPPVEYPFTNSGLSVFELPKRANENAVVGDIDFSFGHKSSSIAGLLGLYVHMPDGNTKYYPSKQLSELPKPKIKLSELYRFIQGQDDIWDPTVGVALVILSCQSYGYGNQRHLQEQNIWLSPTIPRECDALETVQQQANIDYQSLDLLDKRQLRAAYPTLLFPVFSDIVDRAKGYWEPRKMTDLSSLLFQFTNQNILPENILAANRTDMVQSITDRQTFLNSLQSKPTLTIAQKKQQINTWDTEHPKPNNPVLTTRAAVAKAAEEQARRNANAATRKTKGDKERSKMNKLQAARERKAYFLRYGAEDFEKTYGQPVPKGWLGGGLVFATRRRRRR